MHKILSLILATIMMLSCISVFAIDSTQKDSEENVTISRRTELAQLYDIGIMVDVGSGPHQYITRGEMAKIVAQILHITETEMPNSFSDVSSDNAYTNHIGVTESLKIMCGYGNNIFMPDADITYYEVVKTIVAMLGYEPLANQKGGYPHGYLKVANEIGLILYPGAQDRVIDKNDIAKIVIKAIDTPLMVQNSFGDVTEYLISDETIKTKYFAENE